MYATIQNTRNQGMLKDDSAQMLHLVLLITIVNYNFIYFLTVREYLYVSQDPTPMLSRGIK